MIEAFLICCLALPSPHFTHPAIVSYHAMSDEENKFVEWIKNVNEADDVFIHENPQVDKLKKAGYEKCPFTYAGKQIWIRRTPKKDTRGSDGRLFSHDKGTTDRISQCRLSGSA